MISETKLFSLKDYSISPERGILPDPDPADEELPGEYGYWWQKIARNLPKLLAAGRERVQKTIEEMPILPYTLDQKYDEQCMRMLSALGHGFVWVDSDHPAQKLPTRIAVPWCGVAERLGMRPVLSYDSYARQNWRRIDQNGPIGLGNLAVLQNFLGGRDEDWFILVHVALEAVAGQAWAGIEQVINNVITSVDYEVAIGYQKIAAGLQRMYEVLFRMKEGCDPYIYYHRVRQFLYGWTDENLFPRGLYYEGVGQNSEGVYRRDRGESGAYTPTAYAILAILLVDYTESNDKVARQFAHITQEIKRAMPPAHKKVVGVIEQQYRPLVDAYARDRQEIINEIRNCRNLLDRFLSLHERFAKEYIADQMPGASGNPTDIGTGNTPFLAYLKRHREAVRKSYPLKECDFPYEDVLGGRCSS